jgi:hypothetical protein
MPRRLGCARLLFASVWVLTQRSTERGHAVTKSKVRCDHPVTVPVFSSQLQSVRIPPAKNGASLSYGPRND